MREAYAEGWYALVRRQAKAVVALYDNDLLECAAEPIVRCMLEHAVYLQWLARPQSMTTSVMLNLHANEVGRAARFIDSYDPALASLLAKRASEAKNPSPEDHYAATMRLLDDFEPASDAAVIKAIWWTLTGQSHPRQASAAGFWTKDWPDGPNGEPVITGWQADPVGKDLGLLMDAAWIALHIATVAISSMWVGNPWQSALRRLGDAFRASVAAVDRSTSAN